ncbi:alpha-amylase family protein [Schaalia sp. ZJ1691]|uniref:alpha-amylase family protein n=1 Tax=Schaalia sp. ZJ1691 TaxID=2709404 RepID=UPI0013EDA4E8|nr:alpha-amylase family protein [Schaalia sp. ZJ1691]
MPLPTDVRDAARSALESLDPTAREIFLARLDEWGPDLLDGLVTLYGAQRGIDTAKHLVEAAAGSYVERDDDLKRLDLSRMIHPNWIQSPDRIGYAAYTERFGGDLRGVVRRIPYLQELGVTYLHLMPLLTPRPGDSDGGYAVADYRTVREDLGTMEDLRVLTRELRAKGMSLVMDLVLNHVAREHEWARRARAGEQKYRDYFLIFPDRTEPDEYEKTLPEIFPDFAPGNFTWDEEAQGWVWTTFNSFQWDVNWANPEVLVEYGDIILNLANQGVEVLRLDAIAFMGKRKGTDCQGQPEVHAITEVLHALVRIACPAVILKAEAIVAPEELMQYLGRGRYTGKVSDLAYHNSLMVQIWSMMATKDVRLTAHALGSLPVAPASSTWICYARCHDDIGWAISDHDAGAVGLSGYWHRVFLSDWYSGLYEGSNARGLVFQYNPVTNDRRISGTAASLIGLEVAAERAKEMKDSVNPIDTVRANQDVDLAIQALFCVNAMIFGWGGVPVIWSGDELGQFNDPHWAEEEGHEADNRWAHRPRLDEDAVALRHDRSTIPGRVFESIAHLAKVRASLPYLEASTRTEIGAVDDPGVLVTVRHHPLGTMVGLYNVTPTHRSWPGWRLGQYGLENAVDALSGHPVRVDSDGTIPLAPYQPMWLVRGEDGGAEN